MANGAKCRSCLGSFFSGLVRRKTVDEDRLTETKLVRCLTTLDLTALGVGSTLGAGIYVVAGEVAKATAGPAVILSFLIAAAASVLAGLCYAEFGARVPKTGSAYVYSYVSVGELMAFIIGWNLILEYVIGTASVARAWSANFDELLNRAISTFMFKHMPMNIQGVAEYPDFFSLGITLLLSIILAIGVKESAMFTKIFTLLNLMVVLYVIICGFFQNDLDNWKIDPLLAVNSTYEEDSMNKTVSAVDVGSGGFFPFGVSGMLSGASTCFYAFVGFDCIATTGEEVINPQKAIPISIVLCLIICFFAYFGISATITLMCPYFLLNASAPLPQIFMRVGWPVAKYIVAVGSICALSTSLIGCMFPLPRVIYAMASDGLIFRFLAQINDRFKTPLVATIFSGIFAAVMACLFELKTLVDMMSIGTLLAYTLVAVSVLILRGNIEVFHKTGYSTGISGCATPSSSFHRSNDNNSAMPLVSNAITGIEKQFEQLTFSKYLKYSFVSHSNKPTKISEVINTANTYLLLTLICLTCVSLIRLDQPYDTAQEQNMFILSAVFAAVLGVASIVVCYTLMKQPENPKKISFKVPGVPWIPALSIFVNVYLMMKLPADTWMRFAVWMAAGFVIYFAYGIWNSSESLIYQRKIAKQEMPLGEADNSDEKDMEDVKFDIDFPESADKV